MFAFAVWDRAERELWLVRDRLGIKPLYYGESGGVWLFGSELKALRAHPAFDGDLDPDAVVQLLRHGYIPAPRSIHRRIRKLWPGSLLRISAKGDRLCASSSAQYWSLAEVARRGTMEPFRGTPAEAEHELESLLARAVRRRMVSDVPLGAFLSGGVDSSTVVALMQRASDRPVETFSIGFDEPGYDESSHAREVARHLGTDHTERRVRPEDARDVVPELPVIFDEPFADPSLIPTALVSRLARTKVTVSLSGDGGDELFAGYKRYAAARDLWSLVRPWPATIRSVAGAGLRATPTGWLDLAFGGLAGRLSRYGRPGRAGDKLKKVADVLGSREQAALYRGVLSLWPGAERAVPASTAEPPDPFVYCWESFDEPTHSMMLLDGRLYLPDDILTKVDRASMAVGLEARVPLLDHEVVEFAWSLPLSLSVDDGGGKRLLRRVLHRHVPPALVERPKMGFGAPVGAWIRGPLRDWAEALLAPRRLAADGVFDPRVVRRCFEQHRSGEREWGPRLWSVLMFQAWADSVR
jgi:asparagine synthase (glutamine-hydrolysing)